MMKSAVLFLSLFVSTNVFAASDWCIWDGEEYLKEVVNSENTWMEAVYDLHVADDSTDVGEFEGVGSCRFMDRTLGATPQDVLNKYVDKDTFSFIIPSRAYLKISLNSQEMVLPAAFYSAGSNWVYVEKDFYSVNRPVCEKQKDQMITLGQSASGIRFTDIEYKMNRHGGVSAVVNTNSPDSNYLGICHFHKVAQ
jgi:hypothetical protein